MASKKSKQPETPESEQKTKDGGKKRPFNRSNIREIRNYTDGEGREVVELVQVFGKSPEPNIYRGLTTIVVKGIGPGGVPARQPKQFNFAIDAKSVRSAFEKFDESADNGISEWQKDQREQQRISPARGGMPILGPDGKSLR